MNPEQLREMGLHEVVRWSEWMNDDDDHGLTSGEIRAEFAITELLARLAAETKRAEEAEAQVERLKGCGNCGRYERIPVTTRYYCAEGTNGRETGHSMAPWSDCLFTPSRWTERSKP